MDGWEFVRDIGDDLINLMMEVMEGDRDREMENGDMKFLDDVTYYCLFIFFKFILNDK
jgi:hypothetical protein